MNAIELIRTHGHTGAEQRALQRRAQGGDLVRIRAGVLVAASDVALLDDRERHHLLVRASLPYVRPGAAVSHLSAVVLRDWPHVGAWPSHVHLSDPSDTRTRVSRWFVTHGSLRAPPRTTASIDGVPIVDGARTVTDLARMLPLAESLPIIDHVLAHAQVSREQLDAELRAGPPKGAERAAGALELGSALSGSPAESLCRVGLVELGAPKPVQQHRFSRAGYRDAVVDFWFPEQGVVLEVDGRVKYEDPAMLGGRSTADAHWQEKLREDFIRSFPEVRGFVRVTWSDLRSPERLRAKLRRAGVPCR